MKKHLLAFIAIALAVTVSAFTTSKNNTAKATEDDPYFWYEVDLTQSYTMGTTINPGGKELKSVYAVDDCQDTGDPICLVGFANEVTSPYPIPNDDDQIIRKTGTP